MRVGTKLSKIPCKGVEQKGGEGTQRFKKKGGGPAGSRGGCIKKGGGGNPLTNYVYISGGNYVSF